MRGMICTIPLVGEPSYRACNEPPSLEEMQEIVGGYLQIVPRFTKYNGELCVCYCDEEGSLKNMATNDYATRKWREQSGHNGVLRGTVLVLYGDDEFMEAL